MTANKKKNIQPDEVNKNETDPESMPNPSMMRQNEDEDEDHDTEIKIHESSSATQIELQKVFKCHFGWIDTVPESIDHQKHLVFV